MEVLFQRQGQGVGMDEAGGAVRQAAGIQIRFLFKKTSSSIGRAASQSASFWFFPIGWE